jgi:GAF domain-containing protein
MALRRNTTTAGKKSVQLLNALLESSQLLNSTLNLDDVLSILLGLATRNLGADRGTIYLVDREKGELWSRVLDGRRKMEIRLKLGHGIAGTVGKTGRSIVLKDAYKDGRFDKGFDRESGFRTRTMLCTPMKDRNGRIVGVFQILNKKRGHFSGQDERFLTALSIPASIALENARLHEADIRNQRAEKELEVASKIQQQLLPEALP